MNPSSLDITDEESVISPDPTILGKKYKPRLEEIKEIDEESDAVVHGSKSIHSSMKSVFSSI